MKFERVPFWQYMEYAALVFSVSVPLACLAFLIAVAAFGFERQA
jgi:hypothetical protein